MNLVLKCAGDKRRKSHERGVQNFFYPVLVARSRMSATKCGPLAKIGGVTRVKKSFTTPETVTTTGAPAVLKMETKKIFTNNVY